MAELLDQKDGQILADVHMHAAVNSVNISVLVSDHATSSLSSPSAPRGKLGSSSCLLLLLKARDWWRKCPHLAIGREWFIVRLSCSCPEFFW